MEGAPPSSLLHLALVGTYVTTVFCPRSEPTPFGSAARVLGRTGGCADAEGAGAAFRGAAASVFTSGSGDTAVAAPLHEDEGDSDLQAGGCAVASTSANATTSPRGGMTPAATGAAADGNAGLAVNAGGAGAFADADAAGDRPEFRLAVFEDVVDIDAGFGDASATLSGLVLERRKRMPGYGTRVTDFAVVRRCAEQLQLAMRYEDAETVPFAFVNGHESAEPTILYSASLFVDKCAASAGGSDAGSGDAAAGVAGAGASIARDDHGPLILVRIDREKLLLSRSSNHRPFRFGFWLKTLAPSPLQNASMLSGAPGHPFFVSTVMPSSPASSSPTIAVSSIESDAVNAWPRPPPSCVWSMPVLVQRKQNTARVESYGVGPGLRAPHVTPTLICGTLDPLLTAPAIRTLARAYAAAATAHESMLPNGVQPNFVGARCGARCLRLPRARSLAAVDEDIVPADLRLRFVRGPFCDGEGGPSTPRSVLFQQGDSNNAQLSKKALAPLPLLFEVPPQHRAWLARMTPLQVAQRLSVSIVSYNFSRLFYYVPPGEEGDKAPAPGHYPQTPNALNEQSGGLFSMHYVDADAGQVCVLIERTHLPVSSDNGDRPHRVVVVLALEPPEQDDSSRHLALATPPDLCTVCGRRIIPALIGFTDPAEIKSKAGPGGGLCPSWHEGHPGIVRGTSTAANWTDLTIKWALGLLRAPAESRVCVCSFCGGAQQQVQEQTQTQVHVTRPQAQVQSQAQPQVQAQQRQQQQQAHVQQPTQPLVQQLQTQLATLQQAQETQQAQQKRLPPDLLAAGQPLFQLQQLLQQNQSGVTHELGLKRDEDLKLGHEPEAQSRAQAQLLRLLHAHVRTSASAPDQSSSSSSSSSSSLSSSSSSNSAFDVSLATLVQQIAASAATDGAGARGSASSSVLSALAHAHSQGFKRPRSSLQADAFDGISSADAFGALGHAADDGTAAANGGLPGDRPLDGFMPGKPSGVGCGGVACPEPNCGLTFTDARYYRQHWKHRHAGRARFTTNHVLGMDLASFGAGAAGIGGFGGGGLGFLPGAAGVHGDGPAGLSSALARFAAPFSAAIPANIPAPIQISVPVAPAAVPTSVPALFAAAQVAAAQIAVAQLPKFQCTRPGCGRSFELRLTLWRHLLRVHGGNLTEAELGTVQNTGGPFAPEAPLSTTQTAPPSLLASLASLVPLGPPPNVVAPITLLVPAAIAPPLTASPAAAAARRLAPSLEPILPEAPLIAPLAPPRAPIAPIVSLASLVPTSSMASAEPLSSFASSASSSSSANVWCSCGELLQDAECLARHKALMHS